MIVGDHQNTPGPSFLPYTTIDHNSVENLLPLMPLQGDEREQTMATRTRRTHSAVFKANVALAAMGGDKTLAELAQRCAVHPHQMTEWKRPLSERAAEIFGGGAASTAPPVDLKAVQAKMGQLTLEHDG